MSENVIDRAVLARFAGRAVKSAAGEPRAVRKIVEWLYEREPFLELALPRALGKLIAEADGAKADHATAPAFAAAYAKHHDGVIAALDRAARSNQPEEDILGANLGALAGEFGLDALDLGILEIAARYDRSVLIESFCDLLTNCLGNIPKTLAFLLGTPRQAILERIVPTGSLVQSGLLLVEPTNRYLAGPDCYLQIVPPLDLNLDRSFESFQDLRDAIVGKPLTARLDWRDFTHVVDRDLTARLLKGAAEQGAQGINILIYGPPGSGKTEFCKALAANLGFVLHSVGDVEGPGRHLNPRDRVSRLSLADRLLGRGGNTVLLFDEMEDLLWPMHSRYSGSKLYFNRLLENNRTPVLWTCNDISQFDPAFLRRMTIVTEVKVPGPRERARIWSRMLRESSVEVSGGALETLAEQVDIAPAIAGNALRAADLAGGGLADIRRAMQGLAKAVNHGRPLRPERHGEAEFAPALAKADHDLEVLSAKLERSGARDFSLCLSGPSGTGKSAYARHLGGRLGLRSLQKRASDLFDKYIGESEKRIARAFEEARDTEAFLIFDEADSLLGDRREARHSWEVSQVNEMLTWMESHPLPFCCTTNLASRLDQASLRRFTFNIRFDYLDARRIEQACEAFFEPVFAGRPELRRELNSLSNLTPGDFAVVRQQAAILGCLDDAAALARMLASASQAKPDQARPIGFRR